MINYDFSRLGKKKIPFIDIVQFTRIMKLTSYLLVVACVHVSAASLSQTVSLRAQNSTLGKVFEAIKKQTDFMVVYNDRFVDPSVSVSFQVKNVPLTEALEQLLNPLSLDYHITENTIVITTLATDQKKISAVGPERAQQRMVTGQVTDETGRPLEGVTIAVKGTPSVTTTDAEGNYRIAVSGNAPLVFTIIGFEAHEQALGAQNVVNVSLKASVSDLDEVVVVGYGTQKSTDVTGSIARVSGKNIANAAVSNFQQSLRGRVPGVTVTQNTGSPSAGVSIKIRGFNSITAGTQPLYVIDGHPIIVSEGNAGTDGIPGGVNPLSNINPYDIESIDILKDASAAAIYGSQGANGVVIVTTKSGARGSAQFQLDVSTGLQSVAKKLERLTPAEYAEHFIESRVNGWLRSGGDPNAPYDQRGSYTVPAIYLEPARWNPTDWQDVIFTTGVVQKYNLSASGGGEHVRYAISGGYADNQGIVIETGMKNYTFRSNIDADINDRFKIGLRFNPSYSVHRQQSTEGHFNNTTMGSALVVSPLFGPFTEDGGYTNFLAMRNPQGIGAIAPADNPLAKAREDRYDFERARILSNMFLEYRLLDQLKFRTSISVDGIFNRSNVFQSSKTGRGAQAPPTNPLGTASSGQTLNWLNENVLTYQHSFASGQQLTALVGASFQQNDTKNLMLSGDQFPGDRIPYLNAAGRILDGTANRNQWSMASFYSRINYDYHGRYLLTATIRRDGSSRFGQANKYGTFPSLAFAWRMSEEQFMKSVEVVSNLKWRLSYGVSGNNVIPNYAHIPRVSNVTYVLGPSQSIVNAIYSTDLANASLTWETNRAYNLGLDLELFDGRVGLIMDAYHSITDGLLLDVNIPAVAGFTSVLDNVGEVQNKGLEFALNTINTKGEFFWSSSFNMSFNRNKVMALSGAAGDFIDGGSAEGERQSRTVVGKPLGMFYARVTDGIFNNWNEIETHVPQDNNPEPGDRRFKDVNGDGRVDNADRDFVGNPNPNFTFGLINDFSYKGFNVSVLINGSYGNDIWHNYAVGSNLNGNANQDAWVYRNRWKSPDQPGNGNIPKPIVGYSTLTDVDSDFYVHDGSYIRLANVTLSYTLPGRLAQKAGFRTIQVSVSGQNLVTFTDYPGYDPEIGSGGGNPLTFGTDVNGVYPQAKLFTAGLSLQF